MIRTTTTCRITCLRILVVGSLFEAFVLPEATNIFVLTWHGTFTTKASSPSAASKTLVGPFCKWSCQDGKIEARKRHEQYKDHCQLCQLCLSWMLCTRYGKMTLHFWWHLKKKTFPFEFFDKLTEKDRNVTHEKERLPPLPNKDWSRRQDGSLASNLSSENSYGKYTNCGGSGRRAAKTPQWQWGPRRSPNSKNYLLSQKEEVSTCLPTIHFQVRWLLVSGFGNFWLWKK